MTDIVRNFLLPVLLVGLQGPGSAAAQERPDPVRFELPNGLRVWVQEDHTRPLVRVETVYKVGWINEGPGTTGIAHYVEHMVYRATENISDEDIYGFVDRIGGRWTGGTDRLETSYAETVPSWALEEVLYTGAERMERALFDPVEFERERNNVVTEANGYVASGAQAILQEAVMMTSFEIHPYRYYDAWTWARDNLTATRDQAYDYYRRHYGPNNAVLAIVGDVDPAEARRLVERHYASLVPVSGNGRVTLVEPPQRVEKRVTLTYPGDLQHLEIVYRAPAAADPAYPVLAVLDGVLASPERLERAVREAGGSEVTTTYGATPYPWIYRVRITAPPDADPDGLVRALQGELDRIAREGVTDAELFDAKRSASGRAVALRGRGVGGRNGRFGAFGPPGQGPPPLPEVEEGPDLAAMASALTGREAFPWDVPPDVVQGMAGARERVTSSDLRDYVQGWLLPHQRTVGVHVPGRSEYAPRWTDGRPVVGDRLEIPAMRVPPAARGLPSPVPPEALEPLPPLSVATARRTLNDGGVVRTARREGTTAALHVRVRLPDPAGGEQEALTVLAARIVAAAPAIHALAREVSMEIDESASDPPADLLNRGYFDVRVRFRSTDLGRVVQTVAGALRAPDAADSAVEAGRAELVEAVRAAMDDEASSGEDVARDRAVGRAAPAWRVGAPFSAEQVRGLNRNEIARAARALVDPSALTWALVAPDDPDSLADLVAGEMGVGASGGGGAPPGESRAAAMRPAPSGGVEPIPTNDFQVEVAGALPGVSRDHPDYPALQLLSYIVGAPYYGGRLGWALTKGGLTYSSTEVTMAGAATGYILLSTRCDTNNLPATLQAIHEIVEGVSESGVRPWEVKEAQAAYLGRALRTGPFDGSSEVTLASALLDSETTGEELLDPPALSERILALTWEEVDAVARRYYRPELLSLAAVGAIPSSDLVSPFPVGTFKALFVR